MKKFKLIWFLLILCVVINVEDVFASTKVNTRTESNYLVPSDVIVTESIKSDILSTPAINVDEKIYDFADILTSKDEEKLYKQVNNFIIKTKIDCVIVTINNNVKNSTKQYAHDFYNYNNFWNDGILLLLDMSNKSIYVATNGYAYELFPDSRLQPMLKSVFAKVKERKYYEACTNFMTSVSQFVDIGLVNEDEKFVQVLDDGKVIITSSEYLLAIFIFALGGAAFIISILVLSNKMVRKATSAKGFLNKDTMKIIDISEMSLGAQVSKTPLSEVKNNKERNKTNQGGKGIKF